MSRSLNGESIVAMLPRRPSRAGGEQGPHVQIQRIHSSQRPRPRPLDLAAYAAPVLVIVTLLTIYFVAPDFYHRRILEINRRESQLVEMTTVGCLLVALFPLAWAAVVLWRRAPRAVAGVPHNWEQFLHRFAGAGFVTLILLASIFFLGEEINWGQTLRLWLDPTYHIPVQTNLHNNVPYISLQGLGSLGMACAFFVAPLLWRFRAPLRLPRTLAPAMPEGPVIACLAIAMCWKWFKDVYSSVVGTARENTFYWGFVEQINEQKELLVALSLMLYALYRIAAVRRAAAPADRPAAEEQPEPALVSAGRER